MRPSRATSRASAYAIGVPAASVARTVTRRSGEIPSRARLASAALRVPPAPQWTARGIARRAVGGGVRGRAWPGESLLGEVWEGAAEAPSDDSNGQPGGIVAFLRATMSAG